MPQKTKIYSESEIHPLEKLRKLEEANEILQTIAKEKEELNKKLQKSLDELRLSELRYRQLFERAPLGILIIEPATMKIVEFNDIAAQQLGYTSEEFKNIGIPDFEVAEKPEDTKKRIAHILSSEFDSFETRHRTKSGEIRNIIVTTQKLEIKGGTFIHCIFFDITERRKIEAELLKSRQRYKTLYESSKDAIMIFDPSSFKFVSANPSAIKLFEAKDELDLISRSLFDLLPEFQPDKTRSREKVLELIGLTMTKGVSLIELTHKKLNGLLFPSSLSLNKLKFDDKYYLQGIIRDETERKAIEEKLSQSQKMEAIGTLAGGIAHDFNNFLNIIIGYASLMQKKISQDDPLYSYLKSIMGAANKAAHITQGVLAFSRKQTVILKAIDLNDEIKNIEVLLDRLIRPDMNMELRMVFSSEKLTILADKWQLGQVMINLASNARDAMPKGGALTVMTRKIKASNVEELKKNKEIPPDKHFAEISVIDTGPGIDENTIRKMYEPYFTTKEIGKGTGLGLSIVLGIVQKHDGFIFCDSKLGEGTVFRIYLPVSNEDFSLDQTSKSSPLPLRGSEIILIAEDEMELRKVIKETLETCGYKTLEAKDGEEAIKIFIENKDSIQLAILDCVMPKKNGLAVYEEIIKIKDAIKVLLISGYSEEAANSEEISKKGLEYMRKPVTPDELLLKIRTILSHN